MNTEVPEYLIQFQSDRDGRWLKYLAPSLLSEQAAREYIARHMEGHQVRILGPDGDVVSEVIDTAATGEDYRNYIA
jgi:hypothetical protein